MAEVLEHLSAAVVAASKRAEDKRESSYLMAADLLPAYARRYADAEDVAQVARIILGSVCESGLTGSLAAGAAVKRAAQWVATDEIGDTRTPKVRTVAAGDTRTALDLPTSDGATCPDISARWTMWTTAVEVWEAASDETAAVLSALAETPEVWSSDAKDRAAKSVKVAPLARALYGSDSGPRRTAAKRALTAALAESSALARQVANHYGLPSSAPDSERKPKRDTRVDTSGPASQVVRTVNGALWVTSADRSECVSAEHAALILARCAVLPAYDGGTAGEVVTAALSAPRVLAPARRPSGVGIGMVHGNGQRAGGGAPEPRPTMSRKRKRDGGIGSPMVPARG